MRSWHLMHVVTFVFDGLQLAQHTRDTGNMIFSPQSTAGLVGPTWRVTNSNNGSGGVVNPVLGTQLSMVFADDGSVSGDTGCNVFNATYLLSGSISFGPIATSRRVPVPLSSLVRLDQTRALVPLHPG
jgi:heat shock protein HslJ